jgi:predicted acyltransferase
MQSPPNRVFWPRVLSVDALRGLTIALMILVNDPGDWGHVYSQLDHAQWNGFTLTDFVFPNFLFLIGASIIFSLESRIARSAGGILDQDTIRTLALHMFRRALILFAIKIFLSAFPHFQLAHLRLYGVLTRIAICYLAAGLICLAAWNSRRRAHILVAITAALLIGYWALLRFVPVPGFGVPTHAMPILDPDRNLTAWLDRAVNVFTQRWLHTGSLYNHTRDPEGLISTLPAIATTLIGCLTALWMLRPDSPQHRHADGWTRPGFARQKLTVVVFLLAGLLSLTAGLICSQWFPINKNLWTSSYVLFSAGLSLLLLALFYWLIDIRGLNQKSAGKVLLWPWLVFGSNAITAYVVSDLLVEIALWIKVPAGSLINPTNPSQPITVWLWTYRHIFALHQSTEITSFAFAIAFTAVCFLPNWLLWRKKIFIKI